MRIVIVGGAGFIGHHLAMDLKAHGHHPVVIDSLMINNLFAPGHDELHKRMLQSRLDLLASFCIDMIRLDARDYSMLSETVSSLEPDVIVHLAAVAHMDRSDKTPHTTFDHSLRTLENALDVAVQIGGPKFVYLSSSTVYGDWISKAAIETQPCKPKGIYGSLKLAGELMVKAYEQAKGLPYVIIRPSALYGPRCVSGRVLQKFIEMNMKGKQLAASDGELDFTYVKDITQGIRLAVESDVENETFNITYGEARGVLEAALMISNDIETLPANGLRRGTLDVSKARKMLDYNPQWPLEKGLAAYREWYEGFA